MPSSVSGVLPSRKPQIFIRVAYRKIPLSKITCLEQNDYTGERTRFVAETLARLFTKPVKPSSRTLRNLAPRRVQVAPPWRGSGCQHGGSSPVAAQGRQNSQWGCRIAGKRSRDTNAMLFTPFEALHCRFSRLTLTKTPALFRLIPKYWAVFPSKEDISLSSDVCLKAWLGSFFLIAKWQL